VDIEGSLLSRFDAIVLLIDEPDAQQDRKVADHITSAYMDGVERVRDDGVVPEDGVADRKVSPEVGRAWVKMGREIIPRITNESMEQLVDFYVKAREQSNDESISATARQLESGIRLSMAYARMRLSETVDACDVEMAINVSKTVIGQTHNGSGGFDIDKLYETGSVEPKSQKDRKERIYDALPVEGSATPAEVAAQIEGVAESTAKNELETMAEKEKGRFSILRPKTGEYRALE